MLRRTLNGQPHSTPMNLRSLRHYMNLRTNITAALTLALLASSALPASAFPLVSKKKVDDSSITRKPTAAQNALIDKSIVREAVVLKSLKERTPLVETYIQNMKPDPIMGQAPESDVHFLARVDWGKVIGETGYSVDKRDQPKGIMGKFKESLSYITGLSKSLHLQYNDSGFVRMVVIDSTGFDRKNYTFSYVRNDFLGTVKTVVFDVQPIHKAAGRFIGRIWIESQGGNIVRYSGDLAGEQTDISEYLHFESWRTNIQENLWLPTSVYVEETDPKSPEHVLKVKAINHIWGYQLKVPPAAGENTDIVVGADVADESAQATDLTPLGAQREWVQEAEDNVIDRLFTAGLIDAPSPFDDTLAALVANIVYYNKIPLSRPIKVRTLLTLPLESLAVGNTILLSKSLIDTTAIPSQTGAEQLANLNALLAFQVAHIVLGHRIDTKYAFADRLLFPSASAFTRLPMGHTDADNIAAAKTAMDYLSINDPAEPLADGQKYFALYLQTLQSRVGGLKALTTPQIGDSLFKPDGTFWMQAIVSKGPKLDNKDVTQQGAMPLSQFLRFDPWTDQVIQKSQSIEPLLSARDKIPFEITPIYLKLGYYKPPAPPPTPAAAAAPAPAADISAAPSTVPGGAAAPAATPPAADGTAAPATTPPAADATAAPPAGTTTATPTTAPAATPPQ